MRLPQLPQFMQMQGQQQGVPQANTAGAQPPSFMNQIPGAQDEFDPKPQVNAGSDLPGGNGMPVAGNTMAPGGGKNQSLMGGLGRLGGAPQGAFGQGGGMRSSGGAFGRALGAAPGRGGMR